MTGSAPANGSPAVGPVLIFDSGLGGLTVFRHVFKEMPDDHLVYFVDNDGFPYGDREEEALVDRLVALIGKIIEDIHPRAIVIACNTATTIAIDALRAAYTQQEPWVPIVGTVPAIRVAAKVSESRMFSVLATPGTVHRDYTKALIDDFAGDCDVALVGVDQLAAIAEAKMYGREIDIAQLSVLIRTAYLEKAGKRTDTIVLGCTHYPLIETELEEAGPWPVHFIDPAPAIARRLRVVLEENNLEQGQKRACEIIFTKQIDAYAGLAILNEFDFKHRK